MCKDNLHHEYLEAIHAEEIEEPKAICSHCEKAIYGDVTRLHDKNYCEGCEDIYTADLSKFEKFQLSYFGDVNNDPERVQEYEAVMSECIGNISKPTI